MLRAFTSAGQNQPDLDARYLERSRLLAGKMKVSHPCDVTSPVS